MDCTIYLNDRKYRVCDIGEGKCTLVISHAKNIESLYEHFSHQFLALERMIVIDISTSWEKELCQLSELESSILIGDVRLLADIYWLDEFEIMTDKEQSVFHGFAPLESSLNKEKNVALH